MYKKYIEVRTMVRVVYSREITINCDIDDLRRQLSRKLKEKNREHTVTPSGLTGRMSGNKIRFCYRYKKLEEEDISFTAGRLPDLTVHHRYAKAVISSAGGCSSKLKIDFIDDSGLYIRLALFIFFPLFVLFSAFLAFSAAGDSISYSAAGIISLFFAALWLLITYAFIKSIKNERDDTFPLLESEIESFVDSINQSEDINE